jgi:hypothetical protein
MRGILQRKAMTISRLNRLWRRKRLRLKVLKMMNLKIITVISR